MDREYGLWASIRKFSPIPGNRTFQLINYFINLKTDIFIYAGRAWGPFSPEVQAWFDLTYMDQDIVIKEDTLANGVIQYNILLTKSGSRTLDNFKRKDVPGKKTIDDAIDFAYNLLNGRTPQQILILAHVHYIYLYGDSSVEGICKTIEKIDSSVKFTKNDIQPAIDVLRAEKLL